MIEEITSVSEIYDAWQTRADIKADGEVAVGNIAALVNFLFGVAQMKHPGSCNNPYTVAE